MLSVFQNIIRRLPLLFFLVLYLAQDGYAQQQSGYLLRLGNDSIPIIYLDEVVIRGKTHKKGYYEKYNQRRARLEYNVKKVYPYAKIAARKIKEIEIRITHAKSSERKDVIKKEYAEMMKTFKEPLMKLSTTQGKILVRLIYRETQHTSFAHIKEYKGTINAYFWQSMALLFGNNLKAAYDPYGVDSEIEEIIMDIERHKL